MESRWRRCSSPPTKSQEEPRSFRRGRAGWGGCRQRLERQGTKRLEQEVGQQPEGARQDTGHQRGPQRAWQDLRQPPEVWQANDQAGDPQQRSRRDHDSRAAGEGAQPEPEGGLPSAAGDELQFNAAEPKPDSERAHLTGSHLPGGRSSILAPLGSSPTIAEISWCIKVWS